MNNTDYTYGAAATLILGLAIIASIYGSASALSLFGLWFVALGTLITYLLIRIPEVLRARRRAQQLTFTSDHGVDVFTDGFHIDQDEFDLVVANYVEANLGSPTFDKLNVQNEHGRPIVFIGLECWFSVFPFSHPLRPDVPRLAGIALLSERKLIVGWKPRLADTALAHELDHFVRGAGTHCFYTECRAGEVPMPSFATALPVVPEPLPPMAA